MAEGWLVHGAPGTGKSLLSKCVAQELDLPIFIFDLASMCNEEFMTFWGQALTESPCMVLFEDFDAIFHGRDNLMEGDNKLTFNCVLNCISGVDSTDGIFVVLTTNNVEYIDPALCSPKDGPSRPGRIDDVIHLGDMDPECRSIMATRILGLEGKELDELVKDTKGVTAAQFTEICNRRALRSIPKKINGQTFKVLKLVPKLTLCLIGDHRMRIEYDDDQDTVIDKVNKALTEGGVTAQFERDDKEHDGFGIYNLVKSRIPGVYDTGTIDPNSQHSPIDMTPCHALNVAA